ncbi:kinase-like protein [Aulographum hederae CBS 113979]|uniref:Kinase-like protein n=1 Tax=Aulographum hederae CBS 113979 TaxID=1176131 RepID=A0A6G1H3C8_9PEZI|nr:kinase-like protein [Aulographum hederae CBS 113979]
MDDPALQKITRRDLRPLTENFDEEDDKDGNLIFLYSTYGFVTREHVAYFGKSTLRKFNLTPPELKDTLKHIPDEDVYPDAPPTITPFPEPIDNERLYFKGPKLHEFFLGTGELATLTLQEAETLELLKRSPHPNIVGYHGCVIKRGRIVGLVLDRCKETLYYWMKGRQKPTIDIDACMNQITSAVRHLHSLGLAHNDLMPANIMLDEHNNAIVVDFGSCQPFGAKLITAGTHGWIDEDFDTSAQHHDEYALGKIRKWLELKLANDGKQPDQDDEEAAQYLRTFPQKS